MKIKQSETIVIKRSQINFASYNPKNHSKKKIEQMKFNLRKVGFLGGVIWNENTGNLIDGHKRVSTLDIIYNYPQNDYEIKVEKVNFTDKQEKEQNIFQSTSKTDIDYSLLSNLMNDIDIESAGITDEDIEIMEIEVPNFSFGESKEVEEDLKKHSKLLSPEEKKERIKGIKSDTLKKTEAEPYVTITFSSFENKAYFMERFGYDPYDLFIKGEKLEKQIDESI